MKTGGSKANGTKLKLKGLGSERSRKPA